MKVSAIVCTIGRETLKECLTSLTKQDFDDLEIIVVSFDEKVKRFVDEDMKFVFSSKANVCYQRNLGILKSEGDFVCFIDDDAIASEKWVSNLMKGFVSKEVACVGGKIELLLEGEIEPWLKKIDENLLRSFLGATLLGSERKEIDKPLLWGSNICFRKEVFEDVGYFDEAMGRTPHLPLYNEEIELQQRLLKKGYKLVYIPEAIVWHRVFKERLSRDFFLQRAFWQGYSEVLVARRNENFKEFLKLGKNEVMRFLLQKRVFENLFDNLWEKNFNQKIFRYKEIGRIVSFLERV